VQGPARAATGGGAGDLFGPAQALLPRGGGLPLVRALIEARGGTFAFHAEPGMGSAAIIELP
jgi:hypothetical protein